MTRMGSKTLKRILRRKQTSERKDVNSAPFPSQPNENAKETTPFTEKISHITRSNTDSLEHHHEQSRKASTVAHLFRGTGTLILRQFIATLGTETEASLNRAWVAGGATLKLGRSYSYELRQGRPSEEEKIREVLRGRLYRDGNRLRGGGWTRLVLGDDFTTTASRNQVHELRFVVPYCVCVGCGVASAQGEARDAIDEMIADAEQGIGFFDVEESPVPWERSTNERNASGPEGLEQARTWVTFRKLPTVEDFRMLGETLPSQEFELGTVTKINSRGGKVTFSPFARHLFMDDRYAGPMSKREVSEAVRKHAAQHYRQHRGKTTRRFYVHGWLCRFLINCTGAMIFPPRHDGPVGVLFRRQTMSLFRGRLALEGAFGSFLDTEHEIFIGFGQDASGAQSILSNGLVDQARHLGINELRMHCDIDAGKEIEIRVI